MKNCLLLLLALLPAAVQAAPSQPDVPRDAKFEASFTLPGQAGNPFDPVDNDVDVAFQGPRHQRVIVPAFWDGDRWRVRYAPPRVGDYTLSVTRNGQPVRAADLTAGRFHCVPSGDPGFIRRDTKITQRFAFDDGQPYYPLGINVAWTGGNGPDYPVYFTDMGQAHLNWARVWMTYWDGKALEWSPDKTKNPARGTLLLDAARRWDMIFDEAARHGIYVQMVLQHHGQYTEKTDPNWRDNPFNAANGGFLKRPDDFFTDPEARRLTRAKYRYIVARWGYATHLLAFELFNEVQNIGEANTHFQDVVNWHTEMAAYLRSVDVNHHLITTSNSVPGEPLAGIGLDYDQIHTYPPDLLSVFASVRTVGVGTPVFFGEWGPPSANLVVRRQQVHDGLWASLMSPTAGAGQFWFWDQVMAQNWWPLFASASDFCRTFDVPGLGVLETIRPRVETPGTLAPLSFAPPGGWAKVTRTDITLPADGQTPDLGGVTAFIQGNNHREMLPTPITFHVDCASPCQFRLTVGTVAKAGAHPTLSLDGGPVQALTFPATEKDHDADQALSVDVPAGRHTVSLFNTGQDWFVLKQVLVTNYVPAVAILAKGNDHAAVFWAYVRQGEVSSLRAVSLQLPGLKPGPYKVHLWNTVQGRNDATLRLNVQRGQLLAVPLPDFPGDIAGVVTRD